MGHYTDNETEDADRRAEEKHLREMIRDPRYWRDRNPKFVAKVAAGFDRLSGKA